MSARTDIRGLFHAMPFPTAAANGTQETEEEYEARFKQAMEDELIELKSKTNYARARLEKFRLQPDALKMQQLGEIVGQVMGEALGGKNQAYREIWQEFHEQDEEQRKENLTAELDISRQRNLYGEKKYGPVYLEEEQFYKPITRRDMGNPDNRQNRPGNTTVHQKKYHSATEIMSLFTKPLGDHVLTDDEIRDLKSGARGPLNVLFVTDKNPCFAHYYNMHVDMCGELASPTIQQKLKCAKHKHYWGDCLSKHSNWIRARTLEVEELLGRSLKPRGKMIGTEEQTYEEWQEQSKYKTYVTQEEDGQVVEIRYEDPVDLELSPEDIFPYRQKILNAMKERAARAEDQF